MVVIPPYFPQMDKPWLLSPKMALLCNFGTSASPSAKFWAWPGWRSWRPCWRSRASAGCGGERSRRQRCQRHNEGEMSLEFFHQFVISGEQFTFPAFGQSNIQAVIDPKAQLRRDFDRAGQKCTRAGQGGRGSHDIGPQDFRFTNRNSPLTFRASKYVSHFNRKNIRRQQLALALGKLVA